MKLEVTVDAKSKMSLRMVVEVNPPAPRGFLINEIASLGSEMLRLRDQIVTLQTKVRSKEIGRKTPEAVRAQREADLTALDSAKVRLAMMEGRRGGLRWVEREVFGSP